MAKHTCNNKWTIEKNWIINNLLMLCDRKLVGSKSWAINSLIGGWYNLQVVIDALWSLICCVLCAVNWVCLARYLGAKTQVSNAVGKVKVCRLELLNIMNWKTLIFFFSNYIYKVHYYKDFGIFHTYNMVTQNRKKS